ncbi:hypothetical protein N658DRAFT_512750 [Parathielavia hyrcaniae]|uniref:Uncharacterized protein n=1 Tax=Parathielavia hyrcaniae TaxID=113614 RepID=A0AAN6Q976_9PEZI|nr:hypothetical protein N658DRAFT_512750 [Parathielavia hyrcaniae]
MLGLGASHLDIYLGNYSSHALSHRVKAIQGLHQALSTPPSSTAEGDARFAAIFALAFQASCMPHGMCEFLSMVKGCHLIANSSTLYFQDSLFWDFTQEGYGHSVRRAIGTGPILLDPDQEALLDSFLESLRALAPLCTSPLEIRFMASTERVVKMAQVEAAEAFAQLAAHYALINHSTSEEFAPFIDPKHYPAQLLLIHFILVEFAIGSIALGDVGRRFGFREKSCIAWMEHLDATLPDEYKRYAEWPRNYARTHLAP